MNVLSKIYWLRVAIGALAGLTSTGITVVTQPASGIIAQVTNTSTLLNGITMALLFYLISFYVLRAKFAEQVEKKSKIMSMGIFIYFFTWLVMWVLTLTVYISQVPSP